MITISKTVNFLIPIITNLFVIISIITRIKSDNPINNQNKNIETEDNQALFNASLFKPIQSPTLRLPINDFFILVCIICSNNTLSNLSFSFEPYIDNYQYRFQYEYESNKCKGTVSSLLPNLNGTIFLNISPNVIHKKIHYTSYINTIIKDGDDQMKNAILLNSIRQYKTKIVHSWPYDKPNIFCLTYDYKDYNHTDFNELSMVQNKTNDNGGDIKDYDYINTSTLIEKDIEINNDVSCIPVHNLFDYNINTNNNTNDTICRNSIKFNDNNNYNNETNGKIYNTFVNGPLSIGMSDNLSCNIYDKGFNSDFIQISDLNISSKIFLCFYKYDDDDRRNNFCFDWLNVYDNDSILCFSTKRNCGISNRFPVSYRLIEYESDVKYKNIKRHCDVYEKQCFSNWSEFNIYRQVICHCLHTKGVCFDWSNTCKFDTENCFNWLTIIKENNETFCPYDNYNKKCMDWILAKSFFDALDNNNSKNNNVNINTLSNGTYATESGIRKYLMLFIFVICILHI
nr:MAG: hypothetical protein [Metapenaeopsis lamellata majanivirus]